MSTKATVAHGEGFHLYEDLMDKMIDRDIQSVRLELDNVSFEVYPNSITVSIPLKIWEYIRHFSPVNYDKADLSDEELYALAKNGAESSMRWPTQYKTLQECIDGTFEVYKEARTKQREMRDRIQSELGGRPVFNPYKEG